MVRFVFADLLRGFIARAGVTQRELAEALFVSKATVNNWVQGNYRPKYRENVIAMVPILDLVEIETDRLLLAANFEQEHGTGGGYGDGERDEIERPRDVLQPAEHFLGREKEIDDVLGALRPGEVVSLVGPGGFGKSAIMAEVLSRLSSAEMTPVLFPDGVVVHDFYANRNSVDALVRIALEYGVLVDIARGDPINATRTVLSRKKALLVLDGAENADNLTWILEARGSCGMLVATRFRWNAPGKIIDVDLLPPERAVQLVRHYGGAKLDLDLARQLVMHVDRWPVALELAGKHIAISRKTAREYLDQLGKTPIATLDPRHARHRKDSVRILLDKTVMEIGEDAQVALGLIGSLELAPFDPEAIAAAMEQTHEVWGALEDLEGFGLLRVVEGGHVVSHRLVYEYSRRLIAVDIRGLERLGNYYSQRAQSLWGQGPSVFAPLEQLRVHAGALVERLAKMKVWKSIIALAYGLDEYMDYQGLSQHRVQMWAAALQAGREIESRQHEGNALAKLGNAYFTTGETRRVVGYYEQALAIHQEIGDRQGEGIDLNHLGDVYREMGDPTRAIELLKKALAIHQETGDRRSEGMAMGYLGNAYWAMEETELAMECHRHALVISREIGDRRAEGDHLSNLGNAYAQLKAPQRVIEFLGQSLAIRREVGDRRGEVNDLGNLANAHADLGEAQEAIELYERVLGMCREIGDRRGEARNLMNVSLLRVKLGDIGSAEEAWMKARRILEETESPDVELVRRRLEESRDPEG